MRLAQALRVQPREAIAFVGAGGKSSAIARLVSELSPATPVLVSTTTRLGAQQEGIARAHLIASGPSDLERLPGLLETSRSVLLTAGLAPNEPKLLAPSPELLDRARLVAREHQALILIEADGAAGRSLKAPADHEPQIPAWADSVAVLAGLDAIGKPLGEKAAHRAELVSRTANLDLGETVEPRHLAALLASPQGGLKSVPAAATVRVVLNKTDTSGHLQAGAQVAGELLKSDRIQSVLLGELQGADPVIEAHGRVAGIVLAGGASQRMGVPKQLLEWKGRPLAWYPLRAAREGGLAPIVVVLGAQAGAVGGALEAEAPSMVENREWAQGQSSSLRAGLAAVEAGVEAAVFLLVDMPLVSASLIGALVRAHRRSLAPIVAPRAGDRWGNPVLFDRRTFAALHTLRGDVGGRMLFGQYSLEAVPCQELEFLDIDTMADLEKLREMP